MPSQGTRIPDQIHKNGFHRADKQTTPYPERNFPMLTAKIMQPAESAQQELRRVTVTYRTLRRGALASFVAGIVTTFSVALYFTPDQANAANIKPAAVQSAPAPGK
jgi:hypothetical protein